MWQENCNPFLFPEHAWRWSIHTLSIQPTDRLVISNNIMGSLRPRALLRNSPALKSVLWLLAAALLDVTPQDKIVTWACLLCWNLYEKNSCHCCCCCCYRDDGFQGICKWAFRCPCAKEKPTTRQDDPKPCPTTTTTTLFPLHLQRWALRILAANHWQEFWFSYANLLCIVSDRNNSYYYITLISHSTTFLQLQ